MSVYPLFHHRSDTDSWIIGDVRTAPPMVAHIGNTPLIELRQFRRELSPGVRVFAKAEWHNPGGSVKDRAAWYMIRHALSQGQLHYGKRILDATSGNTGIALAMIGAALGVGVTLCLPANATPERKRILRALGAELILTDAMASTDGAQETARELAQSNPTRYFYANQYANPENWRAHYETTGPEIWRQTRGQITHFVCGLGTTGTFTGTSRYLKHMKPAIRTLTFQPDGPLHGLEGLKHLASVHVPEIFDANLADGNLEVTTESAYAMMKRLAREEGLLVGVSAAAAAVAAMQLAATLEEGTVVTVFPDKADKYFSLPVWSEPDVGTQSGIGYANG